MESFKKYLELDDLQPIHFLKENFIFFKLAIIYSYQWRSYNDINLLRGEYTHDTINHSVHFVKPSNNLVHTNGIESMWSNCKSIFKNMKGRYDY